MTIENDPILVTGAAGFIGYHVARRLLEQGRAVVGLDNLNAYYDPALKQARLAELGRLAGFRFERCDLADRERVAALFAAHRFERVVHLAAQAGVRYSLVEPHTYAEANLVGFLNVLEGCRQAKSRAPGGIHNTDARRFRYGHKKNHCLPPKWRGRATRAIR